MHRLFDFLKHRGKTSKALEAQLLRQTSKLAETIAHLHTTLDATVDGIMVVDAGGMPMVWNRKCLEIWHLPEDLLLANNYDALLAHALQSVADPTWLAQRIEDVMGQPSDGSHYRIELIDGRIIDTISQPRWLHGQTVGRVWSFRDITFDIEAKQRNDALIALGQELNTATTVDEAARIITNVADELLHWDACFLNLYNAASDTMETVLDIDVFDGKRVETPSNGEQLVVSPMSRRTLEHGSQLVLRGQDTDPVPLRMFGNTQRDSQSMLFAPIRNGTTVVGVVSIQSYAFNAYTTHDLQVLQGLADHCGGALERIRTEHALHQAKRDRLALELRMLETQKRESLGVLAGGIAHDFNNLLTAMQGNITLARLDLETGHPALESLQQAEVATRRAADLTHQMLAYAGKGQLTVGQVAINEVVGEMRDLLNASLPKQIVFNYQVGDDLPMIEADPTQLRQVIMNLIVNAAEAIGDTQGTVVIQTKLVTVAEHELAAAALGSDILPGIYVSFKVEDTGCGMDSATLRRIFEPFFTTKFTGRGLGLAAVLGIVRNHHGAIHVHSEVGRGTHFQVLLPPAKLASPRQMPKEPTSEWSCQGSALIIDDEPAIQSLIARMLQQVGLSPQAASDGGAGVAVYRTIAYDTTIVLLDLTMPGQSAQETLEALHAIRPNVPVLLMSGYSEQDAQSLLQHPQVVGFLHKPFRIADLRDTIRRALFGA